MLAAQVLTAFRSLGHDILHSAFHFEGKLWRTIPELVLHPGRLTRRYIDGERAKFISPMALFLFTVFVMYAIFELLPDVDRNGPPPDAFPRAPSDVPPLPDLAPAAEEPGAAPIGADRIDPGEVVPSEGAQNEAPKLVSNALRKLEENPDLVLYKMKSTGFKWSWLLVPLSIPFMWAVFFWRREFTLYDHAIFVTYSISFMMLLLIVSTLAQFAGAGAGVQAALLMLVPALHLYKQLRGTYRLSRLGTLVRLLFVLIAAIAVLSAFVTMLLLAGVLE